VWRVTQRSAPTQRRRRQRQRLRRPRQRLSELLDTESKDASVALVEEKYFPGLYKKFDGKQTLSELLQGRYKGVTLTMPLVNEKNPLGPRMTAEVAMFTLLDEARDFAHAYAYFAHMRRVDCKGAPRDGPGAGGQAVRQTCVRGGAGDCAHCGRLLRPARARCGALWFDSKGRICSGTVIAKMLFQTPALYEGIGELLFIFQLCSLKGGNEAVNEGLGGTIAIYADGQRGLGVAKVLAEARIHRNGPHLVHADALLASALDRHFGDKPWHFKHAENSRSRVAITGISLVLKRLNEAHAKTGFFN
jgi:hypothetical protein